MNTLLSLGVLIVLTVVFTLQNAQSVTVKLLFWPVDVSLVVVILAMFLAGLCAGLMMGWLRRRSRKMRKMPNSAVQNNLLDESLADYDEDHPQ